MEIGWFETEDELDEIQRAFVDVLRAHAEAWALNPAETYLVLPGDEYHGYPLVPGQAAYGRLLVIVDIPAPGENLILLTIGAYLDRDRVTGDEIHGQMFTLPAEPTPIGFKESGSPDVLAARTGHWFGTLLHRPIVRHEWLRAGEVYAHRWLFADSGQPLGEGRIRTGDLGPPQTASSTSGERARDLLPTLGADLVASERQLSRSLPRGPGRDDVECDSHIRAGLQDGHRKDHPP